jgi:hypothetical protein
MDCFMRDSSKATGRSKDRHHKGASAFFTNADGLKSIKLRSKHGSISAAQTLLPFA